MKKAPEKYQKEIKTSTKDLFLDHCWSMFENQEDRDHGSVVAAAYYFVKEYEFDIDSLPPKLYDAVKQKLQEDAEDTWATDSIE